MHRVSGRFNNPAWLLRQKIPGIENCRWPLNIDILPPGMQGNSSKDILAGRMTFLNRTEQVGWMPDWRSDSLPKLWLYNLHYFEWLWALGYDDAKAVVQDWIENHKPEKSQQGWESYPISLRLMNLCGVFFAKYRADIEQDDAFRDQLWKSIYLQSEWLMRHLETHLLANHYLENAAALAFVGSCFDGFTAERWLNRGLEVLGSEIPEQILADGMHFELSPMYHSRALYVLAILQATRNSRITEVVSEPIQRMTRALIKLCHPDGQIALFNDSAFGIYNFPKQVIEYCFTFGEVSRRSAGDTETVPMVIDPLNSNLRLHSGGAFTLPNAGYYGWRDEGGIYLVVDAGPIGPDYQPGHAHADIFSYELSLNGFRVIVDSGVHDYENSELRRYSRSTAAHNTAEINETDQSEVWGTFRVARRGIPTDISWNPQETGFKLSGSHNGYDRLQGKPKHVRGIQWDGEQAVLSVCDQIKSDQAVRTVSRIHLHPDCSIKERDNQGFKIAYPAGIFEIKIQGSFSVSEESGWYFPEFGKKVRNTVLELSAEGVNTEISYAVTPVICFSSGDYSHSIPSPVVDDLGEA